MNPVRKRRLIIALVIVVAVAIATGLSVFALQQNMTYLYSPSEVDAGKSPDSGQFRLGGIVKEGSIHRVPDTLTTDFVITDRFQSIPVQYTGILPDLFRVGQSTITTGHMADGKFVATMMFFDEINRLLQHNLFGLWGNLQIGRKLDKGVRGDFAGCGVAARTFNVRVVAFGQRQVFAVWAVDERRAIWLNGSQNAGVIEAQFVSFHFRQAAAIERVSPDRASFPPVVTHIAFRPLSPYSVAHLDGPSGRLIHEVI